MFFGATYALTWSFWLVAIALGVRFDSAAVLGLLLIGCWVRGSPAIVLLHGWLNFVSETVEVADAFYYPIWVLLAVLLVAIWGAETLTSADEVPRPPLEASTETG